MTALALGSAQQPAGIRGVVRDAQSGEPLARVRVLLLATPYQAITDAEGRFDLGGAKASIGIPVAVKLGPFFSTLANLARWLEQAGAGALVLFNRFYQPDFDLEALEIVPSLKLSTQYELMLRLHWVAILWGRVKADLAITGGVHTGQDVLKATMAGAQVVEIASALLQNGIGYLKTIESDLTASMEAHEYESIPQMQGSMSQRSVADPNSFLRAEIVACSAGRGPAGRAIAQPAVSLHLRHTRLVGPNRRSGVR